MQHALGTKPKVQTCSLNEKGSKIVLTEGEKNKFFATDVHNKQTFINW